MLKHLIEKKWKSFKFRYQWPYYIGMLDGWLPKCAVAIPIIGYIIVFNDYIAKELTFDFLANEDSSSFGLTGIVRLRYIYFGLIFLALANAVYKIRRPEVLKLAHNQFDFTTKGLSIYTVASYQKFHKQIQLKGHYTSHRYDEDQFHDFVKTAGGTEGRAANWVDAKQKYEGILIALLQETFVRNVMQNRVSLTIAIFLATVGYVLLLRPSVDLFVKILISIFTNTNLS